MAIPPVLPQDPFTLIFSYLPSISFLPRLARVCKTWRSNIEDPLIWRTIHLRIYCIPSNKWLGAEIDQWREHSIDVYTFVRAFWRSKTQSPSYYVTLGARLYQTGHLNESLGIFSQDAFFESDANVNAARRCSWAAILLKLKRFKESRDLVHPLTLLNPPNGQGFTRLGDICREEDKLAEAEICYSQSMVLGHGIEAILGYLEILKLLKKMPEFQALKHRIDSERLISDNTSQAKYISIISLSDGFEYAKKLLDQGSHIDLAAYLAAKSRELHCRQSLERQKKQSHHIVPSFEETEEVKGYYRQSLVANPFNIKVIFSFVDFMEFEIEIRTACNTYYQTKEIQKLRKEIHACLSQAVRLNPEYALSHFLLGKNLCQMEQEEEAMKMLLRAQELGYEQEELYLMLVPLLLKNKSFIAAERLCRTALIKFPIKALTLQLSQAILGQPNSPAKKEATALLSKQIALDPTDIESQILLAQLLESLALYVEAEENYQKAYGLIQEKREARLDAPTILQKEQDRKKTTDLHTIHLGITRCLYIRGKTEESQNYPTKVFREYGLPEGFQMAEELLLYHASRPTALLFFCLGNLYQKQFENLSATSGISDAAKIEMRRKRNVAFQEALTLHPQYLEARIRFAEICLNYGNVTEAFEHIQQVLKQDSDNIAASEIFAQIALDQSDALLYPEAIRLVSCALERSKQDSKKEIETSNLFMHLIRLHHRRGSINEAAEHFIELLFNYSEVLNMQEWKIIPYGAHREEFLILSDFFTLLLEQSLDFQEMVCKGILEKNPENFVMRSLNAQVHYQKKQEEKAASEWEQALKLTPNRKYRKTILAFLYELYFSLGKLDKSCATANRLILEIGLEGGSLPSEEISERFPLNFLIQYNLGVIHYFRKNLQMAQKHLLLALTLVPTHTKACYLMYGILLALDKKEEAKFYKESAQAYENTRQQSDAGFFLTLSVADLLETPDIPSSIDGKVLRIP